jgi:S1-C subfamily serine protease
MRRYFRAALAALAMITAAALMPVGVAVADIDAQTLKRIKRATVFVSLGQQRGAGSGSGFLVHRDGQRGLVVTNAHVAAKAVAGGLRVVFNSGTRKADSIPATVLGLSRVRDLAVLEIQAPDLPEPLQISANAQVHETQTVHIVGFPFGKGFATNRETPVVTISRGTVSSQRMDVNDQTRLMQIDGDLNPGNSGGPIMDDSGQVVGVAVATIRQTNIGFAIPLAPLLEMLAGTLTDLQAEISSQGVRVSGQLLDPYGRFESAGLHLRAMHEDAVLDLLSDAEQWQPIAAEAPASAFVRRNDGSYAAVHALPENPPGGTSLVAQITVNANGAVRYLPPFRVEASGLSVSLSGPDVLADSEEDESAAQRAAKATSEEASKGGNKIAMASPLESDFDELFNRSGLSGLIASMGADGGRSGFDEGTDSEDERTVKERLREIIAAHWDEARGGSKRRCTAARDGIVRPAADEAAAPHAGSFEAPEQQRSGCPQKMAGQESRDSREAP